MKRSEMLNEMVKESAFWNGYDYTPIEVMQSVLKKIEELGMLPPDYNSPTGCPCGLPECNEYGIINEWEREDEL